MKNISITFGFSCMAGISAAQLPAEYKMHAQKADSLIKLKDYRSAAGEYSKAFEAFQWKGTLTDRYNAACAWAMANVPDSAFFQLNRIVTKMVYTDHEKLERESLFTPIHKDKRWQPLVDTVRKNKERIEAKLNKPLITSLDSILVADQAGRKQLDSVDKKFGWGSPEMKAHWRRISINDSINTLKVSAILDKYGWLGPDVVGEEGANALFLVVQHADQETQEKYLPLMREAVKNGKAAGSSLALLEDRVALKQGKKQIYGSQVMRIEDKYYVRPLEDPDNVDKRRAGVGLGPLKNYVSYWKIVWDVEQYQKPACDTRAAAGAKAVRFSWNKKRLE